MLYTLTWWIFSWSWKSGTRSNLARRPTWSRCHRPNKHCTLKTSTRIRQSFSKHMNRSLVSVECKSKDISLVGRCCWLRLLISIFCISWNGKKIILYHHSWFHRFHNCFFISSETWRIHTTLLGSSFTSCFAWQDGSSTYHAWGTNNRNQHVWWRHVVNHSCRSIRPYSTFASWGGGSQEVGMLREVNTCIKLSQNHFKCI